eukprot:NODE_23_length_38171_cov_0.318108.p19 type:complete len:128 gc:universal NODE_23_length_38171_cov_0.318108:20281-20664(+)
MSMSPALMAWATLATACNPDEHCRLTVLTDVVIGKPADKTAILLTIAPPLGLQTVPTVTSSTKSGLIRDFSNTPRNTVSSNSSIGVSLNPPFFALVIAVLNAQTITTSSSDGDETDLAVLFKLDILF